MGRIVAIDFGLKRCGIAVTDPLKIIATPLTTVSLTELPAFLKEYHQKESIENLVIGLPQRSDGSFSEIEHSIQNFIEKIKHILPEIPVSRQDERYTSKDAMRALIDSGVKKKERRNKALLDSTSATLILQAYLQHNI